jgi:hypothetical protein
MTKLERLEKKCADWNERYPVGTPVFYHPIIGEPECKPFVTQTKAYVLSGHTPVLFLAGKSGCVCLEAVKPR